MNEKKSEKINKNLSIPLWIAELLDREGERLGGPGEAAAAAIYTFCNMDNRGKNEALKQYKAKEADLRYPTSQDESAANAIVDGAVADTIKRKRKQA